MSYSNADDLATEIEGIVDSFHNGPDDDDPYDYQDGQYIAVCALAQRRGFASYSHLKHYLQSAGAGIDWLSTFMPWDYASAATPVRPMDWWVLVFRSPTIHHQNMQGYLYLAIMEYNNQPWGNR